MLYPFLTTCQLFSTICKLTLLLLWSNATPGKRTRSNGGTCSSITTYQHGYRQVRNTYHPPWVLPLFQALVGVSPDPGFPIYQVDNEQDLPRSTGEASSSLLSSSTMWVGVGKVYTAFYLSFSQVFNNDVPEASRSLTIPSVRNSPLAIDR